MDLICPTHLRGVRLRRIIIMTLLDARRNHWLSLKQKPVNRAKGSNVVTISWVDILERLF